MAALQLRDLLERLDRGTTRANPSPDETARAARHAAEVWPDCRLNGVAPTTIEYCTRTGTDLLCHFNAGWKDCFLIVVCPAAGLPMGHLLFDIGAEYRGTLYHDLSTGFVGEPTEQILAESLPRLGAGGTPAAILGRGEGSYLQTYRDAPERYTLEYQLVTTAFHFTLAAPATLEEVQRAFRSYAFGKYEWAREFAWQHQPL